ncbi:hypothetical protein Pcinc_027126 [Petrolisthes cinctipes]|uniref:Uncharacterized protein n=1 Tax=Petrolisthes cinctipes TaxID=88211 RepID=A0AAE1F5J9_PETCI|nr:hypothetical protein Pcinc_027126 [Petrolisthes cinctipes]
MSFSRSESNTVRQKEREKPQPGVGAGRARYDCVPVSPQHWKKNSDTRRVVRESIHTDVGGRCHNPYIVKEKNGTTQPRVAK